MCYEFLFFLSHYGPEAIIPGSGKHHRVMQKERMCWLNTESGLQRDEKGQVPGTSFLFLCPFPDCPGSSCSCEYRED